MRKTPGETGALLELEVAFKAPTVILPFSSNNDHNNQCWVFHLGDLHIHNTHNTLYSHNLYFQLSNLNMQYYHKVKYFLDNH